MTQVHRAFIEDGVKVIPAILQNGKPKPTVRRVSLDILKSSPIYGMLTSTYGRVEGFLGYLRNKGYSEARLGEDIFIKEAPWMGRAPSRLLYLNHDRTLCGTVFYRENSIAYEGPDPRQSPNIALPRKEIILMYVRKKCRVSSDERNERRDGFSDIDFP